MRSRPAFAPLYGRWTAVALVVVLSSCAGPSPGPGASPGPVSPSPVPLEYVLPPDQRLPGYEPLQPAVYDDLQFLASVYGAPPVRFESIPYLTANRSRFVHVQVASFAAAEGAEAAYRNYTKYLRTAEDLCPRPSVIELNATNLLCDNRERGIGSILTVELNRSMLVALTHENRTPMDDLLTFARMTVERAQARENA